MKNLYGEFTKALDSHNKDEAVNVCLTALESDEITILELYLEILTPAMNGWECDYKLNELCIWDEHVRSAIVRTILECCYPRIMKEKKTKFSDVPGSKVAVVCPSEEYHEIGARMVADIFLLAGYDASFVGANTPQEAFIRAVESCRFKYIALSVSSYYNLINTRYLIGRIKEVSKDTKIIVGGKAFDKNPDYWKDINADAYLSDPREIFTLQERDVQ